MSRPPSLTICCCLSVSVNRGAILNVSDSNSSRLSVSTLSDCLPFGDRPEIVVCRIKVIGTKPLELRAHLGSLFYELFKCEPSWVRFFMQFSSIFGLRSGDGLVPATMMMMMMMVIIKKRAGTGALVQ